MLGQIEIPFALNHYRRLLLSIVSRSSFEPILGLALLHNFLYPHRFLQPHLCSSREFSHPYNFDY